MKDVLVVTPDDFGDSIAIDRYTKKYEVYDYLKLIKTSDLDNRTVVMGDDGKIRANFPPLAMNAPFDASDSSITVNTGSTNAVLFMTRTATGTLRNIKGGVQGQIIFVRYITGVSIQSTNSVRLINGTPSPTPLDSNKVSSFLCLAPGIWTELSRNFT